MHSITHGQMYSIRPKNVRIEVYTMPLVMLVNNAIDCIICAIVALLMTFEAISCILPFLVHHFAILPLYTQYSIIIQTINKPFVRIYGQCTMDHMPRFLNFGLTINELLIDAAAIRVLIQTKCFN